MDLLDRSIELGLHLTKNPKIFGKTWEDFFYSASERKIIFYGITDNLEFMWMRADKELKIIAAVDNDPSKQGLKLKDFFDESDLKEAKNIIISSKESLKNYQSDEVVILISSLKSYEEIAGELENSGFENYFSIINLEYNYRESMRKKNIPLITRDEFKHNYAKKIVAENPVQNNKIIFYGHGCYSDHEKYITEQLLKTNKNLDIVWLMTRKSNDVPKEVRVIYKVNWKQYVYELETAKMWIFNGLVPEYMIKREDQIYIQTKHWGSITLKKFYLDAPSITNVSDNKKYYETNGKWIDYIITGSEIDEQSVRRGYGFNGKCLRFGSARTDAMFHQEEIKSKVYRYFNLDNDEKILIYAPTYRFAQGKGTNFDLGWQDLNFDLLLKTLKKKFGGKWKIFLRLHPIIRNKSIKIQRPEYVIDVSNYEDSEELAAAADIMISDYSSIMFEPAYVLKPIFLYAPDKSTFEKNDYELLIDYDSLPFPIAVTNEELAIQIKNFDEITYKENVKNFLDQYGVQEDGHASERIVKFILEIYP